MCEQETLLRPSFLTDELQTIDSSSLETIATGPFKWQKLFSEHQESPSRAASTTQVVNRHTIPAGLVFQTELQYLFLVPGGRILLAHDKELFAVFDLNTFPVLEPVASMELDTGLATAVFAHLCSDIGKLQFALVSMEESPSDSTTARCVLFDLDGLFN